MRYKGEVLDAINEEKGPQAIFTAGVETALLNLSTQSNKLVRTFDSRDADKTLKGISEIRKTIEKLEKAVNAVGINKRLFK